MKIIEMSPEELIHHPVRTALETRPSGPLVIKTEIKPLGACILNVFSPCNEIFWYFGIYRKMLSQLRKYEEVYRNDGVGFVKSLCKRENLPKKNMSLYQFFYPIVSGKGDIFLPGWDDADAHFIWLYAQRHFAVIIPTGYVDKILSYFNIQLNDFGIFCFRAVDEKMRVVGSIAMESLYGYDLICKHPLKMSADQKKHVLSLLNESNFLSTIDRNLSLIVSARGGFSLISNIFNEKNPDPLNLEICKKRFDICSNFLTPLAYESIGLLPVLAPQDEYLVPLFEERLAKLKEKYPVMDMALY